MSTGPSYPAEPADLRTITLVELELELFSTLGGGVVYGWLAWRTRSILWGSIGHVYIVTLVTLAAASGP